MAGLREKLLEHFKSVGDRIPATQFAGILSRVGIESDIVSAIIASVGKDQQGIIDITAFVDWLSPADFQHSLKFIQLERAVRDLESTIRTLDSKVNQDILGRIISLERRNGDSIDPAQKHDGRLEKGSSPRSHNETPKAFYPKGKQFPPTIELPSSYSGAMDLLGYPAGTRGRVDLELEWLELSERLTTKLQVDPMISELLPGEWSKRLANSVKLNFQKYVDTLDELRDNAATVERDFGDFVRRLAEATGGGADVPPLKGEARCRSKASFKYKDGNGIAWYRLTDINRATLLFDTLHEMYAASAALSDSKEAEVLEFNDRYRAPVSGGYRDLQFVVRFQGMVCGLQMNTRLMAAVKHASGHRSFEVSRELQAAIKAQDCGRVRTILSWGQEALAAASGESLLSIINDSQTGLMCHAAAQGLAEIVNSFIQFNGDPNLKNKDEKTPLHVAMAKGHERVVWALLSQGKADHLILDADGYPPLLHGLLMLKTRPDDQQAARVVSLLAQWAGADHMREVKAALGDALRRKYKNSSYLVTAAFDGNEHDMQEELNEFADPNSKDKDGISALQQAVNSGNDGVVDLLIRAGADPHTKDSDGASFVWQNALLAKRYSMVHLFVGSADVADYKEFGCTPADLIDLGFSNQQLQIAGFTLGECLQYEPQPMTVSEELLAKYKEAGFLVYQFREANFNASHCKMAGFHAFECMTGGFTVEACQAAGFSMDEIEGAGFLDMGVSVYFLCNVFMERVLASGLDRTHNIYDIVKNVVFPETESKMCPRDGKPGAAYIDCVKGNDNVGPSSFYLTYAWTYRIGDITDMLVNHCQRKGLDLKRTYVWACFLANNQHRMQEHTVPFEILERQIERRITQSKSILALVTPWQNPDISHRVWCWMDFAVAKKYNVKTYVTMTTNDTVDIRAKVANGYNMESELARISERNRFENAHSSVAIDKTKILQCMSRYKGGVDEVHSVFENAFREWIADVIE